MMPPPFAVRSFGGIYAGRDPAIRRSVVRGLTEDPMASDAKTAFYIDILTRMTGGDSAIAQSAVADMVAPPGAARGTGGSVGGSIGDVQITINIDGRGASDQSLASEIENRIRDYFTGLALQIGAGEVRST
jgi:hypothetical protein